MVFVIDRHVTTHATRITTSLADHLPLARVVVDAGERHRTRALVERIVERATRQGATRTRSWSGWVEAWCVTWRAS